MLREGPHNIQTYDYTLQIGNLIQKAGKRRAVISLRLLFFNIK